MQCGGGEDEEGEAMNNGSTLPVVDRFMRHVVVESGGCWIWTGSRTPGGGYGTFHVHRTGGKYLTTTAHRVSYELFVGPIPEGLQIDHLCRERGCVNWRHMEVVTARENVLRGTGPIPAHAKKTACPRCGGAYTVRASKRGKFRACVACNRVVRRRREGRAVP